MFAGGDAAAPASTGGKHPDKEGAATGAERDAEGAPSLLAARSPPSRRQGGGGDTPPPPPARNGRGRRGLAQTPLKVAKNRGRL